uniref:uncharacterized protein LOC104266039 isoform X2 n=1 Tax=Ciona intestinalis TaxID=7719 RepID=UPI0005216A4C|nr:uncharacterized protein LOC104266039 isoform X2 [Ciona intestinalis]|eukprot:XP_009859701.1 uncharacterized protein LOC104266039 isoform X2 [Ciona intestinalis]
MAGEIFATSVRLGTIRLYPRFVDSGCNNNNIEIQLGLNEITFVATSAENEDDGKEIDIKIPVQAIHKVQAHLQGHCPVIWMNVNSACAAELRTLCGIQDKHGAYFDPDAIKFAERQISITSISTSDSRPFALQNLIKNYFFKIAKQIKIKPDTFFSSINQQQCNVKLMQVADAITKLGHQKKPRIPSTFGKGNETPKKPQLKRSKSVSPLKEETNKEVNNQPENNQGSSESKTSDSDDVPPRRSKRRKLLPHIESTSDTDQEASIIQPTVATPSKPTPHPIGDGEMTHQAQGVEQNKSTETKVEMKPEKANTGNMFGSDEDFTASILHMLKSFTPKNKAQAKLEIHKVLFNIQFNLSEE